MNLNKSDTPMPTPEPCSESEITRMVHDFYGRVRGDALLGPVFDAHIADWDPHLAKMVDFWSSVLLGSGRYSGAPMPKHAALPGLEARMFQRWLALFHETTATLGNEAMQARADEVARRIAQNLWYGYQLTHDPDAPPQRIPAAAA